MAFIDDFKTKFPEFDVTVVDEYFATSEDDYQCYFGAIYIDGTGCDDLAILMLQAHLLYINNKSGSSSVKDKASQSVDGVSVAFNVSPITNQNDAFFMSSKYGQRYLQLRASKMGAFFV